MSYAEKITQLDQLRVLYQARNAIQQNDPIIIAGCSKEELQQRLTNCTQEIISILSKLTTYEAQSGSVPPDPQNVVNMVSSLSSLSLEKEEKEKPVESSDEEVDNESDWSLDEYISHLVNFYGFPEEGLRSCSLQSVKMLLDLHTEYKDHYQYADGAARCPFPVFLKRTGRVELWKEYCKIFDQDIAIYDRT